MTKLLAICLVGALTGAAWGQSGDRAGTVERLDAAAMVLDDIMDAPDRGIPEEVFSSAECVAVVPSMLKGGFVFGAKYGKGVATCRTETGWSAPAFFTIRGGSWGLQIGGEAVDLVMLIMNQRGMRNLLASKFKLGGDASVAAGPVGRHAAASTDWKMRAQVLSYSRSRGLFAGISLEGADIRQHRNDTRDFYGRMVPFRTILTGRIDAPGDADRFLHTVSSYGYGGGSLPPAQPAPATGGKK